MSVGVNAAAGSRGLHQIQFPLVSSDGLLTFSHRCFWLDRQAETVIMSFCEGVTVCPRCGGMRASESVRQTSLFLLWIIYKMNKKHNNDNNVIMFLSPGLYRSSVSLFVWVQVKNQILWREELNHHFLCVKIDSVKLATKWNVVHKCVKVEQGHICEWYSKA